MKFKNRLFPVIICPAWIPELNSVEQGLEGKGGLPGSPEGLGCWRRSHGEWRVSRKPPLWLLQPPASSGAALHGDKGTLTAFLC